MTPYIEAARNGIDFDASTEWLFQHITNETVLPRTRWFAANFYCERRPDLSDPTLRKTVEELAQNHGERSIRLLLKRACSTTVARPTVKMLEDEG